MAAKNAWVTFNGTGTVAISDSSGVDSITDNGVGDYTVNWTVAFANTSYLVVGMAKKISGEALMGPVVSIHDVGGNPALGSARITLAVHDVGTVSTAYDSPVVCVLAQGD